jgi:sterol desaturase/sphingolipid hydroxylase (fatty acid hydroxylase superfamily)
MLSATTLPDRASESERRSTPWAVTWLTWPLLFSINISAIALAVVHAWNVGLVLGALTTAFAATLLLLETLYPLDQRWRMTWRSFSGRDLKYLLAGGLTETATNYGFAWLGLTLGAGHAGPLSSWPLWLAIPAAILAFDFLQYWQHRWSHAANTRLEKFLWKTHAAHHLPEQVYVFMHPAGHPLNFILIRGLIRIPLFYFLGLSPAALFGAAAIIGLQGLVSHCNVDLRAGWFNYIFSGAELHRFHHSAEVSEAQNFAIAFSFLDVLFGTLVYRPGQLPRQLGVLNPSAYPRANQFWKVMRFPFAG